MSVDFDITLAADQISALADIGEKMEVQEDSFSRILFNFALECSIRAGKENQVGLELNGKNQLLAYADDVDLL
jgi:hypothetical protein